MPVVPFIGHIPYFDAPHLVAIASAPLVPILLWLGVKSQEEDLWKDRIAYILASLLILNEIAYRVFLYSKAETTTDFLNHALPINICPLSLIAGLIALTRRSQLAYEIAFFWALTAPVNSILTHDITSPFPSFQFIGYFVSHCGAIWAALYATLVLKMRPKWISIWRAFIAFNVVVVLSAVVDILLPGANYAFLLEPPDADNPFFSAPWPWYLLVIDIMSAGMFALAYLPFHFMDKWKAGNSAEKSAE